MSDFSNSLLLPSIKLFVLPVFPTSLGLPSFRPPQLFIAPVHWAGSVDILLVPSTRPLVYNCPPLT